MLLRKLAVLIVIATLLLGGWLLATSAPAQLSESDAARGIRAALERGSEVAVSNLGRTDGFLGNPKVRIGLPAFLNSTFKMHRGLGGDSSKVDELVTAMNRAAEAAMPEARTLLLNAIRTMSIDDAKRILKRGDDSVTRYFADKTRGSLNERLLPVVTRHSERLALADKYNAMIGRAAVSGSLNKDDDGIPQYITAKALDGLYLTIAEEEKKIRSNPDATGNLILRQVFGGLR